MIRYYYAQVSGMVSYIERQIAICSQAGRLEICATIFNIAIHL